MCFLSLSSISTNLLQLSCFIGYFQFQSLDEINLIGKLIIRN